MITARTAIDQDFTIDRSAKVLPSEGIQLDQLMMRAALRYSELGYDMKSTYRTTSGYFPETIRLTFSAEIRPEGDKDMRRIRGRIIRDFQGFEELGRFYTPRKNDSKFEGFATGSESQRE